MTRRQSEPIRPRRSAQRPSATANLEIVDGPVMVGPFGDYCRTAKPAGRSS